MVFVNLVIFSILFTVYFQTCRPQVLTPLLYSSRLLPQLVSHHGTVLNYNCLYHLGTQLTLGILMNRTKSLLDILPLHPLLP